MRHHPFISMNARCFCQGTEMRQKVEMAMKFIVGEDADIAEETAEGYHGNKLTIMTTQTTKKGNMRPLADIIYENRDRLKEELDDRLDEERVFHLRLSKQDAFNQKITIVQGAKEGGVVDISLKVESYPASREKGMNNLKTWLDLVD